jgi:1-phosphofructokinase family hexose kinase
MMREKLKVLPIFTLTPNPALDLSGHVPQILPNEKNYVIKPRLDPGGNGINVARMMTRLGEKVIALGFVGGPTGRQLENLLKENSIPSDFTQIHADTRTNVTVTNDSDHQQTRLTFPGPKVQKIEIERLFKKIRSLKGPGLFMLGGSLPEGCPKNFHRRMAEAADQQKLGVLIDLPAQYLKDFLSENPSKYLFVKPNLHELEELYSTSFKNDGEILTAARKLNQHFALVAVSLGKRGALFSTQTQSWLAKAPPVRARGSVGAGDSMVGGILKMLAHHQITQPVQLSALPERSLREIISWGVAAGAATAEAEGTALGRPQKVRQLLGLVAIRKLRF